MALDVGPRNSGAAVPAVQPDVKSKRGNSHQRRRQGRRERRRPKTVATEIFFLYTARFAWGLVQMRVTRVLRCQPSSQIEDRSEAPRISGSAGEATRHKIVATEKIVKFSRFARFLALAQATRVPWFQSRRQIEVPREAPCWDRNVTRSVKIALQ